MSPTLLAMGSLDNPAGRLHSLLSSYHHAAEESRAIASTWCEVLGIDIEDLMPELAVVASLVPALDLAVRATGSAAQEATFRHYVQAWCRPIFHPEHHWRKTPSPGKTLIDEGALLTLDGLSEYLSTVTSEGHVPQPDKLDALRQEIDDALAHLLSADDLPAEVRAALSDALHRVLWALDHFRVVGPRGVQDVLDRFFLAVQNNETIRANAQHSGVSRPVKAAWALWLAFSAGPGVKASLEAWPVVLKMLGGG